jgi:hypothetical protein
LIVDIPIWSIPASRKNTDSASWLPDCLLCLL